MGEIPREDIKDIETVNEKMNKLIRKEQGWNVKKQDKTEEGGLSQEEKDEFKKLSDLFESLGGREKLREVRDQKKEQ